MIEQGILDRIRNGVCAVGYLTVPLPDYETYYRLPGKFVVVGTGFLVRDTTVITCRHVIDDLLAEAKSEHVPATQLFVSFVVRRTDGSWGITVRLIRHHDSSRSRDADIGFIGFEIVHPKHFTDIVPPDIPVSATVHVSGAIASYGYPHGSALLEKDGRVQRWGPVVQQGWVSGIAPHEAAATPDELLLDLRAAQGMSGAPFGLRARVPLPHHSPRLFRSVAHDSFRNRNTPWRVWIYVRKKPTPKRTSGIVCPRCGLPGARVIGRSESQPVLYLRCDDCGRASIAPE